MYPLKFVRCSISFNFLVNQIRKTNYHFKTLKLIPAKYSKLPKTLKFVPANNSSLKVILDFDLNPFTSIFGFHFF